jgi:hypothetical protein
MVFTASETPVDTTPNSSTSRLTFITPKTMANVAL